MKKFNLLFSILALFFICSVSFATPVPAPELQNACLGSPKKQLDELDQKTLFDMTRRGVVAVKVTAHLILDKYVNQKLWYGTGFVVDTELGLIVTNAHVAGEMSVSSYEVKFGNGKSAEARLEYIDPCYDFAILSVDKKNIPQYVTALKISNAPLTINTEIYSMGNSSNNEFSTYKGYVFDTESILWLKSIAEQSFQFSGLTVPGASGSPVLSTKGEVVGLLYGGKLVSGAALPISYVKPVIDTLKDKKKFHRYFYGLILNYCSLQDAISAENIPESLLEEYEKEFPDSNNKILYVSRKLTAFDADNSKLESGDIIWKVEGELIGPRLKRIDEIVQNKAGKPILLTVYRDGKRKEIEVPTFELSASSKMRLLSFAGTTFFETTPEIKINLGKNSSGVYISDSETGSAFMDISSTSNDGSQLGGAQIVSIDGKKVSSIDDVIGVIPSLFKKKVFNVRFIKLIGDPQEYSITTKYSPEFAEATVYTFNQSDRKWDVRSIKNPKQES